MADEITYCGYKVDKLGIHKKQGKTEAILNSTRPVNLSQDKAFLGLVTYYDKFVSNLFIANPLNNLLKNNVKFNWSSKYAQAFKSTKKKLLLK